MTRRDFDIAEQCLAHAVGSSVTRAYLRTTMIERRRKVMADWATFLAGESDAEVEMRHRQVVQPLNGFQRGINGLSVFAPMQMYG